MSNDVHVGKDGWLFLSGGSNEVYNYYSEIGYFDVAQGYWGTVMSARLERAQAIGAVYKHMTIPDKLSVYPEFYGGDLLRPQQAPTVALAKYFSRLPYGDALIKCLIDLRGRYLRGKTANAPYYYKTDSHWTFEGCYEAYLALCDSVSARSNTVIADAPATSGEIYLDLGSKLMTPVKEAYIVKNFIKGAKRTFANELVLLKERSGAVDHVGLHVGSNVVFKNTETATDSRTIVIFGDSYSEYRTHQLTGMVAETFAETHFIWSASVDWDYVERIGAHIIVTEMAERFMNLVPQDDLVISSFAQERLNKYLSENSNTEST